MNLPGLSGAIFCPDRAHRWLLWRRWADATTPDKWLMVIGLNPSKADEVRSDPTVSQMVNRGKVLGFTGLLMLNTHAIVGTYPSILKRHPNPVGDRCMEFIIQAAAETHISGGMIVCAWGTLAGDVGVDIRDALLRRGHVLHVFDLTKAGCPRHPRGLSLSRKPFQWSTTELEVGGLNVR